MKKLIIISIILLALIGLGIYESIVSYKVYTEILTQCDVIEAIIKEENFDNTKTNEKIKVISKKWVKHKEIAMVFSNHTAIKDFTQKLNTLTAYLEEGDKKESLSALYTLKVTAEFLLRETVPSLENIL